MTVISQIDKQIDAVRRELRSREPATLGKRSTFVDWGNAWALHPDLHQRECDLFRQRGFAQQERDAKAHKAFLTETRRQQRALRLKKCPTCGSHTLGA